MTRVFLTIICIGVLICPIGCHKKPADRAGTETASVNEEREPNDSSRIHIPSWSESERGYRVATQKTVVSQYSALRSSRLLMLKTELVTVTFDIQDIVQVSRHHSFHPDSALPERLPEGNDTQVLYKYDEFSARERRGFDYCMADLLEQGKFVITLGASGQVVSEIIACEWLHVSGPSQATGGRVFCLKDGTPFFRTVEWIT